MSDRLAICAGAEHPSQIDVVDLSSPLFDKGGAEVSSNVVVVKARSDALKDLAAMTGGKVVGCLEKIAVPYLKQVSGPTITFSGVRITILHPGWMPASSFSYRVSFVISAKGSSGGATSQGFVADSFGFLVGRTEVEVDVSQVSGKTPLAPNVGFEQHLVSTLQGRAGKYAI